VYDLLRWKLTQINMSALYQGYILGSMHLALQCAGNGKLQAGADFPVCSMHVPNNGAAVGFVTIRCAAERVAAGNE
jgi:hypothetical protein